MKFRTTFTDVSPERLMDMMNQGKLRPEQVSFVRNYVDNDDYDFFYMRRISDEMGRLGGEYNYNTKATTIIHTKPMHPEEVFFLAIFEHTRSNRKIAKHARRCPACGTWFMDYDRQGTCSEDCRATMAAREAAGVITIGA